MADEKRHDDLDAFTLSDVESTVNEQSVGQLLRRHLETQQWSQAEAAKRLGYSAKHLNQVLQGHKSLSPEMALAFERVIGWPGLAEQALVLQMRHELAMLRSLAQVHERERANGQ